MPSYFLPRSHLLKLARMVSLADSSPQPGAYYSSAPCSLPKTSRILTEPRIDTLSQVMETNHHLAFWLFQGICIPLYLAHHLPLLIEFSDNHSHSGKGSYEELRKVEGVID